MPRTTLVAFDFFGTLGAFDPSSATSPFDLLWADRDRSRPVDPDRLGQTIEGHNGRRQFTVLPSAAEFHEWQVQNLIQAADYAGVPWNEELSARLLRVYAGRRLRLFSDTVPALRSLGEYGIAWAVCSNASPDVREKLMAELPAAVRPALALFSCEIGARKPHPDMYLPLIDYVEQPERVLFVGDRVDADIDGPRRMGIPAALINRRGQDVPLPAGTIRLKNLKDLIPFILSEGQG